MQHITKVRIKTALLLGAAASGIVSISQVARAQEIVTVTGSRIQSGIASSSPVQSVNADDIKVKGSTSIESLLRDMPVFFNDGDNSATNNSSNGLATVDLHDLTPVRTLVLVDGKRLVAADYLGNVDLNTIPQQMVERVEVLTGGASSVYGGDAVAGVVNIILKKNFEGMELDGQVSQPSQGGGGMIANTGFLMGFSSSGGNGNVTLYADYSRREAIFQGARPFSAFSLNSPAYVGDCGAAKEAAHFGFCPGGSSGIPAGRLSAGAGAGNMFTTSRTLVPYDGSLYNFAPINYIQTPSTHWDFGGDGHYEVSQALDFYTRLTFADNFSASQLAEVPTNQAFTTNYGNPLISAQERAIIFPAAGGPYTDDSTASFNLRRRLVENGARHSSEDHQVFQGVLGAKGQLDDDWSYDVSVQYGRTVWTHIDTGDANGTRFGQGLLAKTDATGKVVCTDPSNGCVPVDIFGGAGAITKAQANFFTVQLIGVGVTQQTDAQASLTGNLGRWGLQSPWADKPVSVSVGTEWRREEANFASDSCLSTPGCSAGFGQTPSSKGSYRTAEMFGEVQIPIIQNAPLFQELVLEGGARYSDYNLEGPQTSFKVGTSWTPTDDVRVRASFNRAIREPNVSELFRASTFSAPAGADPCTGDAAYKPSKALCLASGVLDNGDYLNANGNGALDCGGQCASYLVGNPALKPEIGDTQSFGLVITPQFLPGFASTIDYYDIHVVKAIYQLPFNTIVGACFDPALNPAQSITAPGCALIHRDQFGTLYSITGNVNQGDANIGSLTTRGVDVGVTYTNQMTLLGLSDDTGSFTASLNGTYLSKTSFKSSDDAPETICTGQYGSLCGAPAAKWKHIVRLTWNSPDSDVTISGAWRFIGATSFDQVHEGLKVDPLDAHIPDFNYFDLSGTWQVVAGLELRAGVTNLLDKSPPIVDGSNAGSPNVDSGNTFPGTYDAVGRTFFAGINIKY